MAKRLIGLLAGTAMAAGLVLASGSTTATASTPTPTATPTMTASPHNPHQYKEPTPDNCYETGKCLKPVRCWSEYKKKVYQSHKGRKMYIVKKYERCLFAIRYQNGQHQHYDDFSPKVHQSSLTTECKTHYFKSEPRFLGRRVFSKRDYSAGEHKKTWLPDQHRTGLAS